MAGRRGWHRLQRGWRLRWQYEVIVWGGWVCARRYKNTKSEAAGKSLCCTATALRYFQPPQHQPTVVPRPVDQLTSARLVTSTAERHWSGILSHCNACNSFPLHDAIVLCCCLTRAIPAVMASSPRVLKIARSDVDDHSCILLHVSSDGPAPLDLRLLATEGSNPYVGSGETQFGISCTDFRT